MTSATTGRVRSTSTTPRGRKWAAGLLAAVVLLPLAAFGLLRLTQSRTFQFYGGLVSAVATTEKVVALTFDDGPDPAGTRPLLDALADKGVLATFYLTGKELAAHPDLGEAIVAAGHEVGNHSYTHERMLFLSSQRVAEEVETTDELIRATGYQGPITFRPPYGKKLVSLPRYLSEHHRTTVMWDVEPNTHPEVDRSAEATTRYVLDHVTPGSIVLLHGMYHDREQSRLAVGPVVEGLRARGYRLVTVSDLLTTGPPR
ncbi:polysaccharide deacetylase family protein [Saccharothrix sp. Mg75]|uniref:polysaccharide deacetylase family protein n=1 Tax=Saccharothrix sp. Mg75 TaxID=3445357 RepID=UPI003EEC7428